MRGLFGINLGVFVSCFFLFLLVSFCFFSIFCVRCQQKVLICTYNQIMCVLIQIDHCCTLGQWESLACAVIYSVHPHSLDVLQTLGQVKGQ